MADLELREAAAGHGVGVEVDFLAVGRPNNAVVGGDPDDLAGERRLARLHVAPEPARMVLDPPGRRLEGIADRRADLLVGVVLPAFPADRDFVPGRQRDIDRDAENPALAVAAMRGVDDDPAMADPVREAF